jgi:hypothetical protein
MSITSIGSMFSTPTPVQTPPPAMPVEQIVVATSKSDADNQNQSSDSGSKKFPAQLASTTAREELSRSSLGALIVAQEDARSRPSISAHDGAQAYGAT